MKQLEHIILEEKKAQIDGSEVIDKSQLRQLNLGAELTSSSDECEDEPRRRQAKVSGSMQRSIDRLLRSTLDDQKKVAEKDKFIDKDGKIKFDRRIFDLDVFRTIL